MPAREFETYEAFQAVQLVEKVAAKRKTKNGAKDLKELGEIGEKEIEKALLVRYVSLVSNPATYEQWRVNQAIGWPCFHAIKTVTAEELSDRLRDDIATIEQPNVILFRNWEYVQEAHPEWVRALLDRATHVYRVSHHLPVTTGGYILGWRDRKTADPFSYDKTYSVRLNLEEIDRLQYIRKNRLPVFSTPSDTLRFLVNDYKLSE